MEAGRTILVLGGARSGKSRYAEDLSRRHIGRKTYIATAQAGDEEMLARISQHRDRRGSDWRTVEEPLELARTLESHAGPDCFILVDCITLWISNLMLAERDVASEVSQLAEVLAALAGTAVLVSNEVGQGIVPDNALARAFRDEAGLANQYIASACDEVTLIAAGLPMRLKG